MSKKETSWDEFQCNIHRTVEFHRHYEKYALFFYKILLLPTLTWFYAPIFILDVTTLENSENSFMF